MKLTILLFLTSFLGAAASSYSQQTRFDMKFENVAIREVFNFLKSKSDLQFFYSNDDFDVNAKVNIDLENATVDEVMKQLLKSSGVDYKIVDNAIIISRSDMKWSFGNVQQSKVISGKVSDSSGSPLPGVTILIKGTNQGTITDANGSFSFKDIKESAVLVFSFVGMKTIEVQAKGQTPVEVTMQDDAIGLNEVVAVGYGTQKKVNLTGSVQNVAGEDLVKRSASNTSVALQGLAPGVSVVTSSGRPGYDGAGIKIRGTGSLNSSSNPLILIDGVEGYMNFIDINTIESISVLKDAASASIYGSRASNGVILITTKRAKSGSLQISYNGYAGFNTPTELPDPVNAVEYMEAINLANTNAGANKTYSDELINEYKTLGADNLNRYETNWRKEIIKNRALTHNHSVSVSGGSADVSVFANAAYYSQDGNIDNNSYDRMTMRMNTDARLSKWLKIGADVNIRQSKTISPALDTPESIINKATTFVPIFSGINSDGTWGYGQNGDNPIASAEASGINTATSPELGVKGFIIMNPFKGLEMKGSYSSNRLETKSDYFVRPYDTYEYGVYKTTYPASGTSKYEGWSQTISNEFNFQTQYEKQIRNHFLKALGGIQTSEKKGRSFSAGRTGFNFVGFEDLDNGDISTASNAGSHWNWTMLSFYSRINYNFKERYLLELNGRWDASSRFMKDQRWGFFPSASVGWRISEESFFKSLSLPVNNLKLRGSYGTLGNQEVNSYYPFASSVSTGYGYWFNEVLGTGATQTQVANEKISWEKSSQFNAGLDGDLWDSKLSFSFDYYVRHIDDMLQQFPIPLYVGLSSPWENAGSMRNNGWDLSLTWRDRIGDFSYHLTGNISDVRNTVTNLYGKEYVGTMITREGDALNSWYGYLSDGYFQNAEEIESSPVYGSKTNVKPGYIKYKDISGKEGAPDGVVDDYDRTILGNPSPRFEYSLNMGAEWKRFDFTVFLQGVGKKEIYYSGYGARPFYIGRSIFRSQLDNWTENNRDAQFPLLLIDGTGSNPNNIISDFWVKSGAYMRVKNVVIGYNLPESLVHRYSVQRVRLYASAQNLFTFSDAYKGYDPENSVDSGSFYPLMQTYTFGIDIRF
ncbi:MAG: TonB-dependent receptor [Mangrovibacterium sp.]